MAILKSGLNKIYPDRKDYSLLHTFGSVATTQGLPENFSVYNGQIIPNQNGLDTRFIPEIRPLPYGCTAETTTFIAGLEDTATYPPDDFYFATPPGTDGEGRDIRTALQTAIDRGFKLPDTTIGAKRTAYFNCYGAGAIDDFDAVRIALWINQDEKRGVSVGSYWYPEFETPNTDGTLSIPSFNTATATLHNWLVTGWKDDYLEVISWQGMSYGHAGIVYMSRTVFNALMAQPYTASYTLTKTLSNTPIPIGYTAIIDHLIAFVRNLFNV